jgi:hypothetical protein
MKLATFVFAEVIYQNVKKKVTKTIPRCCNHRRKRGQKLEYMYRPKTIFNGDINQNQSQ